MPSKRLSRPRRGWARLWELWVLGLRCHGSEQNRGWTSCFAVSTILLWFGASSWTLRTRGRASVPPSCRKLYENTSRRISNMLQEHLSRQAILAIRSSLKITPSSHSSCSLLKLLTVEIPLLSTLSSHSASCKKCKRSVAITPKLSEPTLIAVPTYKQRV
jgi:hypothetical protein